MSRSETDVLVAGGASSACQRPGAAPAWHRLPHVDALDEPPQHAKAVGVQPARLVGAWQVKRAERELSLPPVWRCGL
jgi:hypothetical protein